MIYSRPLHTRGIDCASDHWVGLPTVLRFFEHCRWEWLRVPELGLVEAVHAGHGFYVTEQVVALSRRFGQGVSAEVRGALRKVGRVEARAEQDLVRSDGVLLAHCHIRGVWVAPGGRLTRIPRVARGAVTEEPLVSARGADEPGTPGSLFDPPSPLRPGTLDLALPTEPPAGAHRHTLRVRSSDCDIFAHVNAAHYVRFVADSLASQGASPSLHRAAVRYIGQAIAGDTVEVLTWPLEPERWGAAVTRDDEVLFTACVDTERLHPPLQ